MFIEVLRILCFCSGIVPQKENAEFVKIFSFIVKDLTVFVKLEKFTQWASLSHIFLEWTIVLKIDKLNKSTTVKDFLHKTSGVDQGNAEQLNKTTTFVSVFNISGMELRKTYCILKKLECCARSASTIVM